MFHYSVQATSNIWAVFHESFPSGLGHRAGSISVSRKPLKPPSGLFHWRQIRSESGCLHSFMFVGETGGCGLPDTKEFFILPSQRKLRKESKHGAFHPHISHGAPSGRKLKRCPSQSGKLPKGLGLSHPDPGLANTIDGLKVRGLRSKLSLAIPWLCVFYVSFLVPSFCGVCFDQHSQVP